MLWHLSGVPMICFVVRVLFPFSLYLLGLFEVLEIMVHRRGAGFLVVHDYVVPSL